MSVRSNSEVIKYVYELPYLERKKLCVILDSNNFWEDLGGVRLGFSVELLDKFKQALLRPGGSPTDEMLKHWGIQNHTILELFIHLSHLHHYWAMNVIKPFVPSEYFKLIDRGEQNPSRFNMPPENIDKPSGFEGGKNLAFGDNLNKCDKTVREEPGPSDKKILNTEVRAECSKTGNDPLKAAFEGHIPMIPYEELEKATGGWNPANLLGKGGFGAVFKGDWKCTGVAIKRLEVHPAKPDDKSFQTQLVTELKHLNSCRHDNILPLYGFSVGGSHDCLVYQYMPNGSLEDRLLCKYGSQPLSWYQRHTIAIGTARGLQFLHTSGEKPLIHGDIKSANILLDPSLVPKIGDFGLAREGPVENYTYIRVSKVHGTKPYLPNEFIRDRKFSTKVDVYSFGIVLFELATGSRAFDNNRKCKFLKDHVDDIKDDDVLELSDRRIAIDETPSFKALVTIGKSCTWVKPKMRPEMVIILKDLEGMLNPATTDLDRRLFDMSLDSSDVAMTRDRQVTASVPVNPTAPPAERQSNYASSNSSSSSLVSDSIVLNNTSSPPPPQVSNHNTPLEYKSSFIPDLDHLLNK